VLAKIISGGQTGFLAVECTRRPRRRHPHRGGVFVALGRHKNPTKGQAAIDDRPAFLSAKNLEPFIDNELRRSWNPIRFRLRVGRGGYQGNIPTGGADQH
jgi:hypothetical protein